MFRTIGSILVAQALLYSVLAIDVSKSKHEHLELTDRDVVPKTDLRAAAADERGPGFIGDLTVGQHYADETVFRRVVEYNNPTNVVQKTSLTLTVTNGVIHYISAVNDPGSYSVICDTPSSIGTSRSTIGLRVPANSRASITLIVAAH